MNLKSPMNRRSIDRCPSPEQWSRCLESDYQDEQLSEHLEQCEQCRAKLTDVAGEANWWSMASETLSTPQPDLSAVTNTICALVSPASAGQSHEAINEYEIEQLRRMLPAPCHAELIARIGRYELEQLIGRGGMGLVFRAWDTELHRVVAVKTLSLMLLPIGTARERFIREGRAAALLNHPHIVPVYDVITDTPVPALVMQYVLGPTVDQWVNENGPMCWQDMLRIGTQLADALSAAHAEGLVHRDIKPSNVLLEASGTRAKLTDFGLVRAMDDATLTNSGMLTGTPHFMSPEQASSEEIDGRSDLFSLGALLYYLASGSLPFTGREPMAVLHAVCHQPHVPLAQRNAEIPYEVSKFIDQLLHKSAKHRPASSMAVAEHLRALLHGERNLRIRRTRSVSKSFILLIATLSIWQR